MLIETRTVPNTYRPSQSARIYVLQCDACQQAFERPFCQTWLEKHKWGQFCSRKCYGNYRSRHPELYIANTSKMWTPEAAVKISARALERTHAPGYVHSQTGLKRTEATRALQRQRKAENPPTGEKNGMWGRHHTQASREQMSETRSQLFVEGKIRCYPGNSKHGHYTSSKNGRTLAFKSGWEEKTMQWLDANPAVASWDYERVRIPYYYNENKRWYVPDFLITFQDGHREMWEVKPKFHRHAEQVVLKSEAAKKWCADNAIDGYTILTGDELRRRSVI